MENKKKKNKRKLKLLRNLTEKFGFFKNKVRVKPVSMGIGYYPTEVNPFVFWPYQNVPINISEKVLERKLKEKEEQEKIAQKTNSSSGSSTVPADVVIDTIKEIKNLKELKIKTKENKELIVPVYQSNLGSGEVTNTAGVAFSDYLELLKFIELSNISGTTADGKSFNLNFMGNSNTSTKSETTVEPKSDETNEKSDEKIKKTDETGEKTDEIKEITDPLKPIKETPVNVTPKPLPIKKTTTTSIEHKKGDKLIDRLKMYTAVLLSGAICLGAAFAVKAPTIYGPIDDNKPSSSDTTEESTTGKHTTEESTTGKHTTEESTTKEHTTVESTTKEHTTEESTTGEHTTVESTSGESTTGGHVIPDFTLPFEDIKIPHIKFPNIPKTPQDEIITWENLSKPNIIIPGNTSSQHKEEGLTQPHTTHSYSEDGLIDIDNKSPNNKKPLESANSTTKESSKSIEEDNTLNQEDIKGSLWKQFKYFIGNKWGKNSNTTNVEETATIASVEEESNTKNVPSATSNNSEKNNGNPDSHENVVGEIEGALNNQDDEMQP